MVCPLQEINQNRKYVMHVLKGILNSVLGGHISLYPPNTVQQKPVGNIIDLHILILCWASPWWYMPAISVGGSLRHEDHHEFEASLGYIGSSRLA